MRYIGNSDLREWVKENLRKALFQKAHALAVQTGCEILVKFEDHHDNNPCNQYYATSILQQAFRHGGVCEKPEDLCVSGETGMPLTPTSEMGVQSLPMDPGGMQSTTYDRGKFHSPSESPTTHSSKNKSPASAHKRNGPFGIDTSPPHTSDSSSTSAKRKKTHHKNKSTPSSSDGDANIVSVSAREHDLSKDTPSDKTSLSPGLTLSPVPVVPVKQFQCQFCGKRLKSAKSLEKHKKTFHSGQDKEGAASSSHDKGQSSKHCHKEEPPALTPISPERYPCQKCDQTFECPENLDVHLKNFHKKLSKALTPQHKGLSSPRKNTPKRDLTPKRDDPSLKHEHLTPKRDDHHHHDHHHHDHSSKHEHFTPKRDDHSSKHERLTPKRDDYSSKHEHLTPKRGDHSPWYQDDYGHRRDSHTPKQDNVTPKHSYHYLTPKQDHTPRRENHTPDFTPKSDTTPKHDLTPKRDMTPKSDVATPRHMADHTTPSLPSLGLSPQPPFGMESPPAHSSVSSSPLSAPKTPGEADPSPFLFEHDTHTFPTDLPGSPIASHSSGSEPSRPNTPGDAPSVSYEFSDEIQTSIMNIPSISSASELIQESPLSPPIDHYTSPRSSSTKGYRMMSPDMSHKKSSPKKAMRVSDFKAAILSTPGPIVTVLSLQNNGPPSVRQISRIQFEAAIQGLQIADFGYVVPLTVKHNAVLVFVKKSPQEIQEVWKERADDMGLCSLQRYQELYNMPAPPDISEQVKSQLIEQGHVTVEQMNGLYGNTGYDYTMSMEY